MRLLGDGRVVNEYRAQGLAAPSQILLDTVGGPSSYSGESVTVAKMLSEAGVYSAIRMISEAIGMCPLKVYRIDSGTDERTEARTHRSWMMLHDAPNEMCTAHDFWAGVAVHLLAYENALIGKERGAPDNNGISFVESLYLLDPDQYRLELGPTGKTFRHIETNQTYTSQEILHIPGFSTGGYVGRSRAEVCRQAIGTSIARSKFEGAFWRQGGRIPGVIQHPGRLGEAGVRRLADGFGQLHGGVSNMHKTPVLEEGATYQTTGQSMDDMQFVQLREQTMTEIAVMFQLPPAYLGAPNGGSLTYATTESNQIQFATMAVAPLANRIQKALSNDAEILPWNVMFCEFALEALYRADMKTRAEFWKTMKDVLGLDPEYIAARENIPRDALKKEPPPAPPVLGPDGQPQANGTVPPAMTAMQQALKAAAN